MKKLQVENYGVVELDQFDREKVAGGNWGGLVSGIAQALVAVYDVGKAVGRELYHVTHD